MQRPYRYIRVERQPAIFCVRLKQLTLTDLELEDLGAEIARLVDEENCRKLVLVLGPEEPKCLYSVFLAKLVNLQKRLENDGGALALAQLNDTSRAILESAGLEKFFRTFPDAASACAALK